MPRCAGRNACSKHDGCADEGCSYRLRCKRTIAIACEKYCCTHRTQVVGGHKERRRAVWDEIDCPCCLDTITDRTDVLVLQCTSSHKHSFHLKCIKKWFAMDHDTCPCCRSKVASNAILSVDPEFFKRRIDAAIAARAVIPISLELGSYGRLILPRSVNMTDTEIVTLVMAAASNFLNTAGTRRQAVTQIL